VKEARVAKKLEEDALVRIEEDAKRLEVKVLRKRRALVPNV
jgi:hypothetical protein